ncbi:MAG: hypothetical protein GY861_13050, partial [bacterium]|nr:hypothetical protein [bacterium]
ILPTVRMISLASEGRILYTYGDHSEETDDVSIKYDDIPDLLTKIKEEVGKLDGANATLRKIGFDVPKEQK